MDVADDDQVNGAFGPRVATGGEASRAAWWSAYDQMSHFRGDPVATIDAVTASDDAFVMGPVFTITYRLLGGVRPSDPAVVADVERLRVRAAGGDDRERAHAAAALLVHQGEFLEAARMWHRLTAEVPDDFPAYRFAHDVCLHIGDDSVRLPSADRAVGAFAPASREHGLAQGMLAFALEEVGRYDEAERHGRLALDADPDDLWARHALAHVYESTGRHDDAVGLLVPSTTRWQEQVLLSNHVWWHLGLRLLEHGDVSAALAVLDEHLVSTTTFGLADATSLLWRIDLVQDGSVNGDRWRTLADGWAADEQRHTCGFLDMHAAFAFAAVGDHAGASVFWDGVAGSHATGTSFNDITFRNTVMPLVEGIRAVGTGDRDRAVALFRSVAPSLHRIGGSVVQRAIVSRTITALETETETGTDA